ncbi:hypothetical protein ROU88_00930 [Macrococcus capreoli]|nr:hypothetical protein [Macrococcus sp. TMW 2.2395]MCU7557974.1 hypothetical protein [Macrococcus sp. TMW 2.2395]
MRDVYITSTVASDIEKDIERIFDELKKENADNTTTDQSDVLPAWKND